MKIKDLLKQSKPCWKYAAMEPGGGWHLYKNKPRRGKTCATWVDDISPWSQRALYDLEPIFDIEPFDGDWVLCGGCFRSVGWCSAVLAGLVAEAWSDFARTAEKWCMNV